MGEALVCGVGVGVGGGVVEGVGALEAEVVVLLYLAHFSMLLTLGTQGVAIERGRNSDRGRLDDFWRRRSVPSRPGELFWKGPRTFGFLGGSRRFSSAAAAWLGKPSRQGRDAPAPRSSRWVAGERSRCSPRAPSQPVLSFEAQRWRSPELAHSPRSSAAPTGAPRPLPRGPSLRVSSAGRTRGACASPGSCRCCSSACAPSHGCAPRMIRRSVGHTPSRARPAVPLSRPRSSSARRQRALTGDTARSTPSSLTQTWLRLHQSQRSMTSSSRVVRRNTSRRLLLCRRLRSMTSWATGR